MCGHCGSPHIEEQVWSHVNRGRRFEDQEIDAGPLTPIDESEVDYWCPECEETIDNLDEVRWSDQEYCKDCDTWYDSKEMHPTESMCKHCAEEV